LCYHDSNNPGTKYKEIPMKTISTLTISVLLVTAMSACNNAKSPDAVANDVATAEQQAATKVSDAQKSAAKSTDSAETTVDEKTKDLNSAEAKGAYDVASAKADGDHNVAIEKCNALAGDAQKACKDQVDAKYDLAKANAKAALAAQKPQGN
jgi:hypothetical protein